MVATIVTIGDELLIGQVIDTNSAWIGNELEIRGIQIREILSISDKEDAICEALDRAFSQSDLILMTGGLGPTKDDITKKSIAKYFDDEMYFDEAAICLKRPRFLGTIWVLLLECSLCMMINC